MSDLFHEKVSFSYVERVFDVAQRFDSSRSTLRLYRPRPVDGFERGQSVAISSKSLLGTGE